MHELVKRDRTARKYYLSLPEHIQARIAEQAGRITSLAVLRESAAMLQKNEGML